MMLITKILAATVMGVGAASANSTTQKKGVNMSHSKEIINVVNQMSRAMHKGQLENVLKAYEPGATLVPQPGVAVSGGAMREAMNGFVSMKPDFKMPNHEVIESGDIALHLSPWTLTVIDPVTKKEVVQKGLSIAVFRKQKDGSWLMVIDNPYGDHLLSK